MYNIQLKPPKVSPMNDLFWWKDGPAMWLQKLSWGESEFWQQRCILTSEDGEPLLRVLRLCIPPQLSVVTDVTSMKHICFLSHSFCLTANRQAQELPASRVRTLYIGQECWAGSRSFSNTSMVLLWLWAVPYNVLWTCIMVKWCLWSVQCSFLKGEIHL